MDLGSSIRRRRRSRGKDSGGGTPSPGGRPTGGERQSPGDVGQSSGDGGPSPGDRGPPSSEKVINWNAVAAKWHRWSEGWRARLAGWRRRAANLRDRAGDWREKTAGLRERAGDWRESTADLREKAGHLRRRAGRAGSAGAGRALRGLAAAGVAVTPRIPILTERPLFSALIVTGGGLASGYLVATTFFFRPPPPPPALQGVPDLRGHPLSVAIAELADSGLTTSSVDSIHHPAVPGGIVIGQSPLPGRTATPRAPVRVTVSLGPDVRPVPDVTRLPGSRAAALLAESGFMVEVDTVESMAPAGRVIRIEPGPGTPLAIPGSVRMAVSLGPPTMPMPSLAGLSEPTAVNLLRSLGLTVSRIEYRYSLLNVNVVFGQYPDPNAQIEQGSEVQIIVGRQVRRPFGTFFRERFPPPGAGETR